MKQIEAKAFRKAVEQPDRPPGIPPVTVPPVTPFPTLPTDPSPIPTPQAPGQPWVPSPINPNIPPRKFTVPSGPVGPALEAYQKYAVEPFAAAATVIETPSVAGLVGIPGFTDEFAFNPGQFPGQPDWRKQYQENIPLGSRIATEIVVDIGNLSPGMVIRKGVQAVQAVRGVIGRGLKRGVDASDLVRAISPELKPSLKDIEAVQDIQIVARGAATGVADAPVSSTVSSTKVTVTPPANATP